MSAAIENGVLAIRLDPANPDHHLWNNNGTWWCHFTIYPDALTRIVAQAFLIALVGRANNAIY